MAQSVPVFVGLRSDDDRDLLDYPPLDLPVAIEEGADDGAAEDYAPEGLSAEQLLHEHITDQYRAPVK